jgi:hypothetical protein
MYNCSLCGSTSQPGESLLRHVIYGPGKAIHRELPVCPACKGLLDSGVSLEVVRSRVQEYLIKPEAAEFKPVLVNGAPTAPISSGVFRQSPTDVSVRGPIIQPIEARRDIDPARAKHRPNARRKEKPGKPRSRKRPATTGDKGTEKPLGRGAKTKPTPKPNRNPKPKGGKQG